MKKKDAIYSDELIVDDLADGLPDAETRRCRITTKQVRRAWSM